MKISSFYDYIYEEEYDTIWFELEEYRGIRCGIRHYRKNKTKSFIHDPNSKFFVLPSEERKKFDTSINIDSLIEQLKKSKESESYKFQLLLW